MKKYIILSAFAVILTFLYGFNKEEFYELNTSVIKNDKSDSTNILPNGVYRFDIAFAEWQGKSMGEKVTVKIQGDSVKIIYEGDGQLTLTKKGEILDYGLARKHHSGVWIISQSENDTKLPEVGGCVGGPSVIDFKNKKFWLC